MIYKLKENQKKKKTGKMGIRMRKLFIKDISKVADFSGRCKKYGYSFNSFHFFMGITKIQENKQKKTEKRKKYENYSQPSRVYGFVAIESYEIEEDWRIKKLDAKKQD